MKKIRCSNCNKEFLLTDCYKCRICEETYCSDCSLDHFGLYEKDGEVKYKNIFKTMLWLIRKRLIGR